MKLVLLGDEQLTKNCDPVTDFNEALSKTVQSMFQLMREENGIGLAAPQVGIQKRFFVVQLDDGVERVFINPEIIQTSQELCTMEEGCLSIPKFYADVSRAKTIRMQFLDLAAKPHVIEATGLLARVIQHENDHLNGVLFIDRIAPEQKKEAIALMEKRKNSFFNKLKLKRNK